MIELIYSIDDSSYLAWQADLLEWSAKRVGMDCRITKLTGLDPDREQYSCLNRFWSISNQWVESEAETVVILDPDMIFVKPLHVVARQGMLIGNPYGYLYDLGWCPLVLHRSQVREFAIKSLALSRALHANGVGWISEMWAANICANMMKLWLERQKLCVLNCDPIIGDAAVIHYCYDEAGFSKQRYHKGEILNCPNGNEVQKKIAEFINECFASRYK